jgi:NAD(P)-dependent dehydrogenase (short-subunit alcohol dehydrogenase family)
MRTAVVTGSSSGIGAAIATRLLADGWRVTGLDRAAATITHPAFTSIAIDLGMQAARRDEIDRLDAVDALVHAAGIMRGGRLGELDHDAGDLLWRIHVDAAIRLADHFAPRLSDGGRIVLIGSRAAKGVAAKSQYGAAKAALTALARAWALELIGRGITVNVVAPAATETAMLIDPGRAVVPPETPPLGRRIRPGEVAALVSYLLSEDAAAITGQEISICGGASL